MSGARRWMPYLLATVSIVAGADRSSPADLTANLGDAAISIRLNVSIDDRPLDERWDEFFGRLFVEFDRDGDGSLSAAEAERAPSAEWLRNQTRGDFVNVPKRAVVSAEFFGNARSVSRERFVAAYRTTGVNGVDARIAPPPKRDDRINRALFLTLAGSADRPLTEASFRAAYENLRKCDIDDDERLSEAELSDGLHRIPKSSDQGIGLRAEPHGPERRSQVTATACFRTPDPAPTIGASPSAPLTIAGAPGLGAEPYRSAAQELRQQFETDDADGNGALDERETELSPNAAVWKALTGVADRDDDRSLTVAELNRLLKTYEFAASLRVEALPIDGGHPLFATLDADDDRRLTLRELRNGWTAVKEWDTNKDAKLAWNEVPRSVTIVVSRGPAKPTTAQRTGSSQADAAATPSWFRRTDRNEDGDVSAREFLGPLDVFEKLDLDHDGIIGADEAATAAK